MCRPADLTFSPGVYDFPALFNGKGPGTAAMWQNDLTISLNGTDRGGVAWVSAAPVTCSETLTRAEARREERLRGTEHLDVQRMLTRAVCLLWRQAYSEKFDWFGRGGKTVMLSRFACCPSR